MNLHVIGGFLGSGKTTAIATAAKLLLGAGQCVGVITNDQGKYLVDTAFFRAEHVPTVEVTGGCFCCNYDDLDIRLAQLQAEYQPDVIFAESVGSCADVVATVIKPLLELSATPASLSVFADSRLLYRRLRGDELPFAENVIYLFDKQLEEASLIVINKVDLLGEEAREELTESARRFFGGKHILMLNALDAASVCLWVDVLQSKQQPSTYTSLDIDYQRYAAGEAALAWLDAEIGLELPETARRDFIQAFLLSLNAKLDAENIAVGHLKLIVTDGDTQTKISLTTVKERGWETTLPMRQSNHLDILLNLRAQTSAQHLETLVRQALDEVSEGFPPPSWSAWSLHPGLPKPTYRLA